MDKKVKMIQNGTKDTCLKYVHLKLDNLMKCFKSGST